MKTLNNKTDPYCAQLKEETIISTGQKQVLAQQINNDNAILKPYELH
jgi:hypothetical protein